MPRTKQKQILQGNKTLLKKAEGGRIMKHKSAKMICLLIAAGMFFIAKTSAFSEDIRDRMLNRVPVINSLKAKGIVGENNSGYLEFRGNKEKADVVEAENNDRKTIYSQIAQQQGASIGVVEKHRAAQIEQRAASGEWLQDAVGKWYQKK